MLRRACGEKTSFGDFAYLQGSTRRIEKVPVRDIGFGFVVRDETLVSIKYHWFAKYNEECCPDKVGRPACSLSSSGPALEAGYRPIYRGSRKHFTLA